MDTLFVRQLFWWAVASRLDAPGLHVGRVNEALGSR